MNPRRGIDAPPDAWLDAAAAARLLGVKRETLYAYASRGLVRSAPAPGSRTRRYRRADLERLAARRDARAGHGAVAAGALLWGEPVLDSAITRIEPDGHRYRGVSAVALAADGARFEQVVELLLGGTLPEAAPHFAVASFGADPSRVAAVLPPSARPLDAPTIAMPIVAAADADRHAWTPLAERTLLRRLVASFGLLGGAVRVEAALASRSVARSLLVALGARPSAASSRAVDRALVLCADHELNPSSFAARVAAAAGADRYACVSAALATLSGPVHGGATERVEALLAEAGRPERALTVVRERLRRGEALPGFGHRLYPAGDPRARPLLAEAVRLAPRALGVRTTIALVEAMDLAGQAPPTLDLGLVALAFALRLPTGAPLAIFAAGRAAGWLAHALEQRASQKVVRPRARYVGP